jgi:hypothetical protein
MELLVAKELQEGMPGGFSSGSKWEKGRGSEEIGAALIGANDSAGRNERKERKAASEFHDQADNVKKQLR